MESHFEGTKFWPTLTFGSHSYWNRWTHGSQNFGRSIGGAIAARTCGELCPWGRVISNNAVWTEALPRQYRHWPICWTFLQRVFTAPVSLGPGCWKAVILCEAQRAEREPGCLGREFSDAMKSTPRRSELINLIKGIPKGLKKLWHGNQGQRVRAKSCRLWEKRSRCHKLFIFIVCAWCIIFFKPYDIWRVSLFHLGIWRDLRLWKRHQRWLMSFPRILILQLQAGNIPHVARPWSENSALQNISQWFSRYAATCFTFLLRHKSFHFHFHLSPRT